MNEGTKSENYIPPHTSYVGGIIKVRSVKYYVTSYNFSKLLLTNVTLNKDLIIFH